MSATWYCRECRHKRVDTAGGICRGCLNAVCDAAVEAPLKAVLAEEADREGVSLMALLSARTADDAGYTAVCRFVHRALSEMDLAVTTVARVLRTGTRTVNRLNAAGSLLPVHSAGEGRLP